MLYYFLYQLHMKVSGFNVFRYITFRTVLSILTALIISFILTPYDPALDEELNAGREFMREYRDTFHQLAK